MASNESTRKSGPYLIPYSEIPRTNRREVKDWEIHLAMKDALRILWLERNYSSEEEKRVAFEYARELLQELLHRLYERTELLSGKPLD
jgi:hypothetical protein